MNNPLLDIIANPISINVQSLGHNDRTENPNSL